MTVEERAKEAAGNHRHVRNLAWDTRPKDDENWALIHTVHRDSDNIDKSNAAVIEGQICEVFPEEAHIERFHDWLVGWSENLVLRVYDAEGQITPAFRAYDALAQRMERYPLLDESLYSEMEVSSIEEVIEMAIEQLSEVEMITNLPEDWRREVYQHLLENYDSDIRGDDWWPNSDHLIASLRELDYLAKAPASEIEA